MYLCILDHEGNKQLHRNMQAKPRDFLNAIQSFRDDLIVGVECMFTWYWLADLCLDEGITFILGHALYMRAIHGGKKKDDKLDSEKTVPTGWSESSSRPLAIPPRNADRNTRARSRSGRRPGCCRWKCLTSL
jgi:hypothetical protein